MEKVFISDDFEIMDWESHNIDRYQYAVNASAFVEYLEQEGKKPKEGLKIADLKEKYPNEWEKWNESASYEEIYEIPMMNALRYFPSFVSFEGDEPTSGSTCLLYDNELEQWAVGMTGGGMDLSPHLLDTFIMLGEGIPSELASGIERNWNAYVNKEQHEKNCDLLAEAMKDYGNNWLARAKRLEGKQAK